MNLELQQNWGRLIHGLFFQFIEGLITKLKLPDLASFTAEEKVFSAIRYKVLTLHNRNRIASIELTFRMR